MVRDRIRRAHGMRMRMHRARGAPGGGAARRAADRSDHSAGDLRTTAVLRDLARAARMGRGAGAARPPSASRALTPTTAQSCAAPLP
eukprot:SAG31_NODE_1342_length_8700_cov_12.667829_8_plen_87_part_00